MNSANYQTIQELLSDLHDEYNQITEQINSNQVKMKEEKSFPEEENKILLSRKEDLCSKINKLEKVLADELEQSYINLKIQEADRQRIARDLHDTSLQNLTHLIHKIELSSMYIDTDPLNAKLELAVVSKNLKLVIEEIRNTIFNLRPMTFDDLGMKAALERLVTNINENKDYEIDLDIEDVSCENNLFLVSVYRIIQECLNNIVKHAEATKIYFHCKIMDNKYCIVIKDNGKGFKVEDLEQKKEKHFGISLIKERIEFIGGKVEIHSDCEGTTINISIPILNV